MKFLWIVFIITALLAETMVRQHWPKGETLLSFFKKHHIPTRVYYDLDNEAKELADEIRAGVEYFAAYDTKGRLVHLLVPINEELQLHLMKKRDRYILDFVPIFYQKLQKEFSLSIHSSPYRDIIKRSGNIRLAREFVSAFKHRVDFSRSIYKGDRLAIIYEQKIRLGKPFGMPQLKAAVIETKGKKNYVFYYKGSYYNEFGKKIEKIIFKPPIKYARITSRFTLRRWHPILHRYRAHLGVDFGARRGTPVRAAGSGNIVFAGRKGGYGKTVIIAHKNGYRTLYAHLSKIRRGIYPGKYVYQGQVIGYVGSTGLSTGPHLHFGLYKNNRAINPLPLVKMAKSRLWGKKLKEFKKQVQVYKRRLDNLLQVHTIPEIPEIPEIYDLDVVWKELWCKGWGNAKG